MQSEEYTYHTNNFSGYVVQTYKYKLSQCGCSMQMNSVELFFQSTLTLSPFTGINYAFIQGDPEAFCWWKEPVFVGIILTFILNLLLFSFFCHSHFHSHLAPCTQQSPICLKWKNRNNVKQRQLHIRLESRLCLNYAVVCLLRPNRLFIWYTVYCAFKDEIKHWLH